MIQKINPKGTVRNYSKNNEERLLERINEIEKILGIKLSSTSNSNDRLKELEEMLLTYKKANEESKGRFDTILISEEGKKFLGKK